MKSDDEGAATSEPGRPNCLLIVPRDFHSVARNFNRALTGLGYAVTEANEDYPENALGKILSKLDLDVARWWTRRTIGRRFLAGRRWNLVVIVKGRGVGPDLVADLKRHSDRVVGYHFDALAYDRATERWAAGVDRVTTFDYRDAAAKGWPLVELYAVEPPPASPPPIRYRLTAILRNHSHRLAFVDRVFAALGADRESDDVFVYLFEKSLFSFAANFVRNPGAYWRWRRHIHFTPLDYARYTEVLGGSDFTLDYAHPAQTGATIRSFEALAMGVKLISNNRHMLQSRRFGPDNVVICDDETDPALLRSEVERLAGRRPEPFQRTPEAFIREIVG